jgi:hypothetical protein
MSSKKDCHINPLTGRAIKTSGVTYKKLMEKEKKVTTIQASIQSKKAQSNLNQKKDAVNKLKAVVKRKTAKKPDPPKKFGYEDLPGDVKGLISGMVKKNKNRKEMLKDLKEKAQGYKLPGYTKMTNEELYDYIYSGKLDKEVEKLNKKNEEKNIKNEEKKKENHILTLFHEGDGWYGNNKNYFQQQVAKYSIIPTSGLYNGDFENNIRKDLGNGNEFIKYFTKNSEPGVVAFKDNRGGYVFITLYTEDLFNKKVNFMKVWNRIYPKLNSSLERKLEDLKLTTDFYFENFINKFGFEIDDDNKLLLKNVRYH